MRREIPASVIAVCGEIVAFYETHATLNSLFTYAGASGDPPEGTKRDKAIEWLRRMNNDKSADPLKVLGRILEPYMDGPLDPIWNQPLIESRARIKRVLAECDLQYLRGGSIVSSLGTPTRTLAEFIRDRDLGAIDCEFERAIANVGTDPREAVSAASNILESVCKVYIQDESLEMPAKQDLPSVWNIVRIHLGLDPSRVENQDLQRILTGMFSVVHGIGALRTHASSAHGSGRMTYKLEPRHARLAIHAAHTVALYVLESWHKRKADV
ncbi:MAG: abortive infection family protein [Ignavibacteriae bacterium]|nr:abortive infection family protein [Ignavibacteriota bacterium]